MSFADSVIRSKAGAFNSHCLIRTVKFSERVIVCGSMSSRATGTLWFMEETVNRKKYRKILEGPIPSIERLSILMEILFFNNDTAKSPEA